MEMEAANQIEHSKIEFSIGPVVVWFNRNLTGCNNFFFKLIKLCSLGNEGITPKHCVMQSFIFTVYHKHSVKTFGEL